MIRSPSGWPGPLLIGALPEPYRRPDGRRGLCCGRDSGAGQHRRGGRGLLRPGEPQHGSGHAVTAREIAGVGHAPAFLAPDQIEIAYRFFLDTETSEA